MTPTRDTSPAGATGRPRRAWVAAVAVLAVTSGLCLVVAGVLAGMPTELRRAGSPEQLSWVVHRPAGHELEVTWVERPPFAVYLTGPGQTLGIDPTGTPTARDAWLFTTESGWGQVLPATAAPRPSRYRTLRVRLWPVAGLLIAVPLVAAGAVAARRRRLSTAVCNPCPACGYDLRGLGDPAVRVPIRCPECGGLAPPPPRWPWAAGKWRG